MSKVALITGLSGQDGSYLAEFLLRQGYTVYGLVRRTSMDPFARFSDPNISQKIHIVHGNLRDQETIDRLFEICKPDEVYNLAAQSHVGVSFECPTETIDINYHGVGRIVDAALRVNPKVRIYQASTSEMFGASVPPQSEDTPFLPVSPYAEAKLRAHQDFVVGYREKHNAFICSGILFNHESPRRGKNFVTRKITFGLCKVKLGLQDVLELGNLDAKRDWGFAGDYVELMWKMLQQDTPDDYVIATGHMVSVRDFVNAVANYLGMPLVWEGDGVNEVAKDATGKVIIRVNPRLYRPTETSDLCGNPQKAKEKLNWSPKVSFDALVRMMVDADLLEAESFKKREETLHPGAY